MKMNVILTVLVAAMLFGACKDDQGPTQGEGQVSGIITDASTGSPLLQVNVQAQTVSLGSQTMLTDENGSYRFLFELDSAISVTLTLTKSGYRDTSIAVTIQPGVSYPLSVLMTPRSVIVGGTGGGTGLAQTITFLGSNPTEISVYGVGGHETSILSFEVRDSLGLPIDAAHAVILTFTPLGGPGGGEYVSPQTAVTNAVGRAYTTFNSGIRSGVVQMLVTTTVGGRTISTSPIRLIINAGFPDQTHFTVAPEQFNFPTLGIAGQRNAISVIVGDVYSNPVESGTAVYYRTSAGVIQASVFTSADGEGSADLISGNPVPFGTHAAQPHGDGYHYVVARTIGENGAPVQDSVLILWSGHSQISQITPGTFDIPNEGFENITFVVSDALGHPLGSGTTIRVEASVPPPPDPNAEVNQVQLAFGQAGLVVLDDFLFAGPGSTEFGFRLSDGSFTVDQATAVSVSISVTGPNGSAYVTINGLVH
ncbi:MAG: hypothetical protein ACKVRP_10140 [Bacteroidota bacterium]